MSKDTKSPGPKTKEEQKIAAKKDELTPEQLGEVAGGGGTGSRGRVN